MPSFLTALARGTVKGLAGRAADKERKDARKRDEELENARLIAQMADNEGFVVQDEATADAPIAVPRVQKSTGTFGGDGALKDLPMPELPDPKEKPARRPMEIARATVGGRKVVLGVNPSETRAGKKATRDAENKDAHERLKKLRPGSAGAFDPAVDYIEHERGELEKRETIDALVSSGAATKEEAELLVRNKIDLPARRRQESADRRAEERDDRAETRATETTARDKERLALERRRVAATEARASRSGSSDSREDLRSVERQVDDTRSDIGRAQTDAPSPVAPGMETPGHAAASAASRRKIAGLQARADSLGRVRDSIAGVVQGRKPAAAPAAKEAPTTPSSSGVDQKAIAAEFAKAASLYRKMLATPGIDKKAAKQAYDETVALISKRHGAVK
jgi:hypothetical protein